jgi:hypothetical protein
MCMHSPADRRYAVHPRVYFRPAASKDGVNSSSSLLKDITDVFYLLPEQTRTIKGVYYPCDRNEKKGKTIWKYKA